MKTRKLVLIVADVILLAVCVLQGIISSKSATKTFLIKDEVEALEITTPAETIRLQKDGDDWLIGDKKYPASLSSVQNLIKAVSSIRTLDKVGHASNAATEEKFGLENGKRISVNVISGGKTVRLVVLGKESSAGSQGYITIDGSSDVYLASGNLRSIFSVTTEQIRSKIVWAMEEEDIQNAEITAADGKTWALTKMGSGSEAVWTLTGSAAGIDVDSAKAQEWFKSLATLTTQRWADDEGKELGQNPELIASGKVVCGFETTTFQIYKVAAAGSDETPKYYGACSQTPYSFELTEYSAQKFTKDPKELAK